MKYKTPQEQAEFGLAHPDVQQLVRSLDAWSASQAIPEAVVTDIFHTACEMEDAYWRQYQNALRCGEAQARIEARKRFSWHRCFCAVDLRSHHYTEDQLRAVMQWIRNGRNTSEWEIMLHGADGAKHVHVAKRDFSWRKTHIKE